LADCTGERFLVPFQPRLPVRAFGQLSGYWVRPDDLRSGLVVYASYKITGFPCTDDRGGPVRLLRASALVPLSTPVPSLPDVGPLHQEKLSPQ